MTAEPLPSRIRSRLLAGPRGRRFALEYAIASDAADATRKTHDASPPRFSLFALAHEVTPEPVDPHRLAAAILGLPLAPASPALLRTCLAAVTDAAAYWQEPDAADRLAATRPVRRALERVALHLVASPHFRSWWAWGDSPLIEQWLVDWEESGFPPPLPEDRSPLLSWRAATIDREERAARDKPRDPRASYGDYWWSIPHFSTPATMPPCFDGVPSCLWYVEDSLGWKRALTRRAVYPPEAPALRYCRIDSGADWAALCARFPIEVTAITRHDWYRTTGRDGRWVIPDWAEVARFYDAVCLTPAGYLSAAGIVIPVSAGTASMIAGWHPGQTYWFSPLLRYCRETVAWERGHSAWIAVTGAAGKPGKSDSTGS